MAVNSHKVIYALQDRLTRLICSIEGDFYLTGGTCLNRFYFKKRFSDDLHFFYMDPSLFRDWIRETGADNVENILANKLTAIVGRNEPKDVFDFHTIVSCAVFNWKEILDAVKLKCVFESDALLARLRSFPVAMLDRLSVTDSCNMEDIKTGINMAINSMITGGLNKPWDIASSKDE